MKKQNYVCDVCGKKYTLERHYLAHMKKHEPIEKEDGLEGAITKEEVCDGCGNEPNIPKVEENTTHEDIMSFMKGLGGRTTANRLDIEKMFNWYKFLYPKSKVVFDWTCRPCVNQAAKRLKQYYNKHK